MTTSMWLLTLVFGIAACQTHPDVMTGLRSAGQFNTFADLLQTTNVLPFITSAPHFTVFAPTDHAFSKITPQALQDLKNDHARMTDLIAYHVALHTAFHVPGTQDAVIRSSNNHPIRLNVYPILHTVTANGILISVRNIAVAHGLIQGLDSVLSIPTSNTLQIGINRPDLSIFANLVISSGLLHFFTSDQNQTLFIPNNSAFQKFDPRAMQYLEGHPADLQETLKFHLVRTTTIFTLGMRQSLSLPTTDAHHDPLICLQGSDGSLSINQAKIVERDIIATDGVIHILDSVLLPTRVVVKMNDQGIIIG